MSDPLRDTPEPRKCGVDMPYQGEGNYCPCQLPQGHEGPHRFKRLMWPQGSNDPGAIFAYRSSRV